MPKAIAPAILPPDAVRLLKAWSGNPEATITWRMPTPKVDTYRVWLNTSVRGGMLVHATPDEKLSEQVMRAADRYFHRVAG
jgi:hypothetical protein